MPQLVEPESEKQLADLVHWALAGKRRLNIEGHGTHLGFGYGAAADITVSTRALSGITDYQPAELVMTARAGTSRAEVAAALASQRQHLAFEPPAFGPLFNRDGVSGTIAGVFMSNLSGPRRFTAGAARDHLLGVRGVSGRGDVWKSGGRVIKNVTGYDLCKLMAGSWGTLSLMTELTFKVLPAPEISASILIHEADPGSALALLSRLAGNSSQPSGLAYLPAAIASRLTTSIAAPEAESACVVRVEGSVTAVRQRLRDLRAVLRTDTRISTLEDAASRALWDEIRDVRGLAANPVILRVSLAPFSAREMVAEWSGHESHLWYADAAGGCIWIGTNEQSAAALTVTLRRRLAGAGSVVLFRAPEHVKREIGVFSKQPEALAALSRRIKHSFDPEQILNPGRLAPA